MNIKRKKDFLKEAGVLLIVIFMIVSTIAVTADTIEKEQIIEIKDETHDSDYTISEPPGNCDCCFRIGEIVEQYSVNHYNGNTYDFTITWLGPDCPDGEFEIKWYNPSAIPPLIKYTVPGGCNCGRFNVPCWPNWWCFRKRVAEPAFAVDIMPSPSGIKVIPKEDIHRFEVIDLNTWDAEYSYDGPVSGNESVVIPEEELTPGKNYTVMGYVNDDILGFNSFHKKSDGFQELPQDNHWAENESHSPLMHYITHIGNNEIKVIMQYRNKSVTFADGTTEIDIYLTVAPPTIDGPATGNTGTAYTYSLSNPGIEDVTICVDWDDGSELEYTDLCAPGVSESAAHTWSEDGTYVIKVKSINTWGAESDWTEFEVTMPKNRAYINTPLIKFLQKLPNLLPILRYILELQ